MSGTDPARGFGARPLFGDDGADPAAQETAARPLRLLVVCTANISRSPYAELRATQMLAAAGSGSPGRGPSCVVASAGVPGYANRPMDPQMRQCAIERGAAARVCDAHRSRCVTPRLLDETDLVLTMEKRHRDDLLDLRPQVLRRVLTLAQAAQAGRRLLEAPPTGRLDAVGLVRALVAAAPRATGRLDVPDPYRRGGEVAHRVADLIDGYLVTMTSLTTTVLSPLATVEDGAC